MIFQKLKTKIRYTGETHEKYGRFEIVVSNKKEFLWRDVFKILIESGFQV